MAIAAGRLRHAVTVQAPARVPDGAGGWTETPATIAGGDTYGELAPVAGKSERLLGERLRAVASHVLTIRYLENVNERCSVLFEGRTFAVRGVANVLERDELLVLALEELR